MGEAIGQALPLAVAAALSPFPIIAVILILVTPRARVNAVAFVIGWLAALTVVGAAVLLVAASADASENGQPATWVDILKLVLGALFLVIALEQWRGRPHDGDEPVTPAWMGAVEHFSPLKAAGAGAVLAGLNPKNTLLAIAAAASIAQTGIPGGEQAVAYAVFAIIASLGVAAPIVIYFAMGDRAGPILDGVKQWMARNNAVIMAVLCLVIGAKLLGDGIAGLS